MKTGEEGREFRGEGNERSGEELGARVEDHAEGTHLRNTASDRSLEADGARGDGDRDWLRYRHAVRGEGREPPARGARATQRGLGQGAVHPPAFVGAGLQPAREQLFGLNLSRTGR